MSDEHDLEGQIKAWATDVADHIPAWRADRPPARPTPSEWRRRAVALAAAAAIAGVVGWLATLDNGQTIATGGSGESAGTTEPTRTVGYERFEYRVTAADLTCPGGGLAGNVVSSAPIVFEAWADREARVWKNVVTYPDGAMRLVVAKGSAFYPAELWAGGADPTPPVGCVDGSVGALATEPGHSSFVSLNPLDDIPTMTDSSGSEVPMVNGYATAGVRQPEPTADSLGRQCTIWRQATPGSDGQGLAVHQQIDWCVDTDTGKVLELTWSNGRDGIGIAETRQTLIDDDPKAVPNSFFSTEGLQREPAAEFPNGPPTVGSGAATATTVSSGAETLPASLPCPAGMNHIVYGRESTSNGQPQIAAASSPTDDPRQAVIDQWRGLHAIDELDVEPVLSSGEVVSLFGRLNGQPVIQFLLHHDGTGLILDSVWTCGYKGGPPAPPTSAPVDPTTPTLPPALDCRSGIAQTVAPGLAPGSATSSSGLSPSPIELAESALAGQSITTPDAGPVTYEITEQTDTRAVVQARTDGRLVAVVWFRWSSDIWNLDGMQACHEA